jgi:type II secretory pathway predicted ATPase ExeA
VYLAHYGLHQRPFSKTPDPAFLFPSRQHGEALARLAHAVEEREVAVLTGEVGAGKTTLSRALVDDFAERCRFSFVINPALPAAQLLMAIAEGFGLRASRTKGEAWSALGRHLSVLDEAGTFPVVVVDEAQLLSGRAAWDELRLLTNLAADDRPLVGLILIGQPELRERLLEQGGEPFAQRVGVAYHVGPLDAPEVERYLAHRLAVAGRSAPLFAPDADAALHRLSGGLPRRLNQLASHALLEGFARDAALIGAPVIEAVAADLRTHLGTPGSAR